MYRVQSAPSGQSAPEARHDGSRRAPQSAAGGGEPGTNSGHQILVCFAASMRERVLMSLRPLSRIQSMSRAQALFASAPSLAACSLCACSGAQNGQAPAENAAAPEGAPPSPPSAPETSAPETSAPETSTPETSAP